MEYEGVEEVGGGVVDIGYGIKFFDVFFVGGDDVLGEVGVEVFYGNKIVCGGIVGVYFVRVEFVDCGVEGDDFFFWVVVVGYEDGEGGVGGGEFIV